MKFQKPKGTYDILPDDSAKRNFLYQKIRTVCNNFNYSEILTPAFEKTELFRRGIGETSDIVSKEMYSFNNDEFTLRPELTAGVIRAYLENNLYNISPITKLFYIANMFRRERPQAGRFREFWQFGIELIGSNDVHSDAEVICLGVQLLNEFGLLNVTTKINSIGSPAERSKYLEILKEYLISYKSDLSEISLIRLEKNPLRILDTKDSRELEILSSAPVLYDYLSTDTKRRFEKLLAILDNLNVRFETDYRLVRGFDYYTDTAFEIHSGELGAQNSVLGGGRYNNLIEQFGGKPTPAIGFGLGIERLLIMIGKSNYKFSQKNNPDLYVGYTDETAQNFAFGIAIKLRISGLKVEIDFLNRSVKSQLKEANRLNVTFSIVIGENEINSGFVELKNMHDGKSLKIKLSPNEIYNFISKYENETSTTGNA